MKFHPSSGGRLTKIAAITLVLGLFCLWSIVSFAEAVDWYQWRGPDSNGVSSESGWSSTWPADGPEKLWELKVGVGYSSVAVSNGNLYTMGNADGKDTIYCLDANTGDKIWTRSYPCTTESGGHPGPASTPTVDDNRVYTLSREGHIHCLDVDSGEVVWTKHVMEDFGAKSPEWDFASSPLILNNMVILDVGMTLALDKATGELVWKTRDYGDAWEDIESPGGGYSTAYAFSLNGSQRLAVFNASGLVILNPENGEELMLHPWKTSWNVNAATPIVSDDRVFISSGYNVGCALLQISGSEPVVVWQNKNMRNHINSCVLWEGHLYGFDEKRLRCLELETGEEKWTQKGLGKGSLMVADGKLIALSDKGKLVIAEATPDAFKELASAKVLDGLCWTVPVLSNGKIYCRNHDDGHLVCLDVSGD